VTRRGMLCLIDVGGPDGCRERATVSLGLLPILALRWETIPGGKYGRDGGTLPIPLLNRF